ncbi:MAG: hypothetical protein JRH17_00860 [Deltaproteobacteria bacterium]|nr:hypothetical protein [Deltaproteobacteria bacterium]
MNTQQLSLADSPPMLIPLSFFALAPIAIVAAGAVLLVAGSEALTTRWAPSTLGLTHIATLGLLTSVMLGALYQMIAVVVGSPVPWPRAAHLVLLLFVIGAAGLCLGLALASDGIMLVAVASLVLGLLIFVVPVGLALARSQSWDATVFGISAALASLLGVMVIGAWMAIGLAGAGLPGARGLWSQAHLSIALLGWVGGLIAAVSWQVLPMFYLVPNAPPSLKWAIQIGAALAGLLPASILLIDRLALLPEAGALSLQTLVLLAALPGALAIWIAHPVQALLSLKGRRRKRVDGSLLFWQAGLVGGLLTALLAAAAFWHSSPQLDLLFGWFALWGWAGMIMHGMLTRIVPFVYWLSRCAPLVGRVRVRSVRKLLPDAWTRRGFAIHLASLGLGAAAILSGWAVLARLTGLSLVIVGLWLGRSLLHVVRQPPELPAR